MLFAGHCVCSVFDSICVFVEEGLCRFFVVGPDGIGLVFISVRDKVYVAVCVAKPVIQLCLEVKELFLDLAGLFLIAFGSKECAVQGLVSGSILLYGGGRIFVGIGGFRGSLPDFLEMLLMLSVSDSSYADSGSRGD